MLSDRYDARGTPTVAATPWPSRRSRACKRGRFQLRRAAWSWSYRLVRRCPGVPHRRMKPARWSFRFARLRIEEPIPYSANPQAPTARTCPLVRRIARRRRASTFAEPAVVRGRARLPEGGQRRMMRTRPSTSGQRKCAVKSHVRSCSALATSGRRRPSIVSERRESRLRRSKALGAVRQGNRSAASRAARSVTLTATGHGVQARVAFCHASLARMWSAAG